MPPRDRRERITNIGRAGKSTPKSTVRPIEIMIAPDNVNIGNLELIAAAFDSDDRVGPWGPFSVQAVSDVDSGAVIPEFNTALNVAGAATIVTITALRRKRRLARDVKNRVANLLECFPSSQVGF